MPPCWASETNADTNGIARVRPARHRSPIVWGRYEVEMYMNKQAAAPQVRLAQATGPRASARCFIESRARVLRSPTGRPSCCSVHSVASGFSGSSWLRCSLFRNGFVEARLSCSVVVLTVPACSSCSFAPPGGTGQFFVSR